MSKLKALGRGIGTFLTVIGVGVIVLAIFIIALAIVMGSTVTGGMLEFTVSTLIAGFVATGIGAGLRSALSNK